MELLTLANGGMQVVPQLASVKQLVYLDFDGELTQYRNPELDLVVSDVEVKNSGLTEERIAEIVAMLNEQFGDRNVLFTSDKSDLSDRSDYSTVYIGKTSSFDPYGNFAGLAETVDTGNRIKNDNAFVILDATESNAKIVETIAHETSHLIGTLDHGGEGLQKYAADYYVSAGITSTGLILGSGDTMYVKKSGTANNTTINAGGSMTVSSGGRGTSTTVSPGGYMYVSNGGSALSVKENGGYVSAGKSANVTFVTNSFSDLTLSVAATVHSGTTAIRTVVSSNGRLLVSNGGIATSTAVNSGGSLYVYSGGTVDSTIVQADGSMIISSGGTALSIQEHGGYVDLRSDTHVTFVSHAFSDLSLTASASATVHSGTTAIRTAINSGGRLYVSSGGLADGTIHNSGGSLYVESSGTANNTIVNAGASMWVDGGTANSTVLNSDGRLYISRGGKANNTVVSSGGVLHIVLSGSADSTAIEAGGVVEMGYVITGSNVGIIYSGGTVNNTVINSDGILYVSRGGSATNTKINTGGSMKIASGTADDTTVNSGGNLNVESRGIANNVTVDSGGNMYVGLYGTATAITVNSSGNLQIASGGTALAIKENGGYVYVDTGAITSFAANSFSDLTLTDSATVHSGTTAIRTILNSGGKLLVSNGGLADVATVNVNGAVYVASGGTALSITENGGYVSVAAGASATFIANSFSNTELNHIATVHSGTTANNIIVQNNGALYVYYGGIADNACIKDNGSIDVLSGGSIDNTTLRFSGSATITGSGTALNTMVSSGGSMAVSSGGTALNTTVNSGGSLVVSSGGTALAIKENGGDISIVYGANATFIANSFSNLELTGNATIHSGTTAILTNIRGGTVSVSSGGLATETTLVSSGLLLVSRGGTANRTTVNSGGSLRISSGGTANCVEVNSGGYMYADYAGTGLAIKENGGCVYHSYYNSSLTFVVNSFSDLVLGSAQAATVHSGTTANRITLDKGGNLYVYTGGIANNTTIHSGGTMGNKGIATNLRINSGGSLEISNGGTATGIIAESGALLEMFVALDTYIEGQSAGSAFVMQNAMLSGYIYEHGSLYVASSGRIYDTTITSGRCLNVWSGGVAYDTIVNSGCLDIYNGGLASDTIVNADGLIYVGGNGAVNCSGTANGITINSRGSVWVRSGTVNNTSINSGGSMYVEIGTAYSTILDGGKLYVGSSASANHTTVNSGGYLRGYAYGHVYNTTVNSGGSINIAGSCIASNTTVNAGAVMEITDYASALAIRENGGYVSVGGRATFVSNSFGDMVLSSTQSATVHSGTTANRISVNIGGKLNIYSGGKALAIKENGGYVFVESSANVQFTAHSFSDLELTSSQTATVHSGTTAIRTTLNSSSYLDVFSGGIANSTTISGGRLLIQGGTANSTIVNSGASMYVYSGGTANSTAVNSGGRMYVYSGGIVAGTLQIANGAYVYAYTGAIIDFTVAEQANPETALINDWSLISGRNNAVYTITVNADQASGTYVLAGGAADFNQTVTVKTTGNEELGMLYVGESLEAYGCHYTLTKANNGTNLILSVIDQRIVVNSGTTTLTTGKTYTMVSYDGDGGAVYVNADGTLSGNNVSFTGNTATADGGVIYNSGSVILAGGTFSDNFGDRGGVIFNANTVTFTDVRFAGNSAFTGGVIFNESTGIINIVDGIFSGNTTSYGHGGAIFNQGTISITNGLFSNNKVCYTGAGGAIFNYGTASINGGTFSDNSASTCSGIQNAVGGTVNLSGHVVFSGNSNTSYGGAINNNGVLNFSGEIVLVTENDDLYNSGTLNWDLTGGMENYACLDGYSYLTNCGTLTITVNAEQEIGSYIIATGVTDLTEKEVFTLKIADNAISIDITVGGDTLEYERKLYSLSLTDGNLTLSVGDKPYDPPFEPTPEDPVEVSGGSYTMAPKAGDGGVAAVGEDCSFTGTDVTFAENIAYGNGGAFNNSGELNLDSVTFDGNAATGLGGAIYNDVGGEVNMNGLITLATETDTIENLGTLNWDLTGGTSSYAALAGFDKLNNSGTLALSVNANQELGDYIIASGVEDTLDASKKTFVIHVQTPPLMMAFAAKDGDTPAMAVANAGEPAALTLTVDGYGVANGNQVYTLTHDTVNQNLVLSVSNDAFDGIFYNPGWTVGDNVAVSFRGVVYQGVVGNSTNPTGFYKNRQDAIDQAGTAKTIAAVGSGTISSSGEVFKGCNVIIAPDGDVTYQSMVIMGSNTGNKNSQYTLKTDAYTVQVDNGHFAGFFVAGDAMASSVGTNNNPCFIVRQAKVTTVINGGTFDKRFIGGSYYALSGAYEAKTSTLLFVDSISLTINGGSFGVTTGARFYAGNSVIQESFGERTAIGGDIDFTINATSAIAFGEHVICGSQSNGVVGGNVNVTITGDGSNLTFADGAILWGGCSGDYYLSSDHSAKSSVKGTRNLTFSGFTGVFSAKVNMFQNLTFTVGTNVQFTASKLDWREVETWNLTWDSVADLGSGTNNFKDDSMNVDLTGWDSSEKDLLTTTDAKLFETFGNLSAVTLGGETASWNGVNAWCSDTYALKLSGNGETKKISVVLKSTLA